MLRTYAKMILATARTPGARRQVVRRLLVLPMWYIINHTGLALDRLLFPGYRKVKIVKPIFLMGFGRSGTTFLHRVLNDGRNFCAFETWELFFPSLTIRTLLRPLVRALERRGRDVLQDAATGHEARLRTVEEEELLFLHIFDTQFVERFTSLKFSQEDFPELFYNDTAPHRHAAVGFLAGCLQRQIYSTGKSQVLAKANPMLMRARTLREHFPDAKFVYLVRNPIEAIASHLSQRRRLVLREMGARLDPALLERYLTRRYALNVEMYRYAQTLIVERILPPESVIEVRYPDLVHDLYKTLMKIVDFTGLQVDDRLKARWRQQADAQAAYQAAHKNVPLSEFGLTEDRVRKDLDFVFERYGF